MNWSTGILGINARNILYIKPFNKKRAIRLADNKLASKDFFYRYKIPTATVYKIIKSKTELANFSFQEISANSFVIKPNRGFGGEGIKVVTNKKAFTPEKEQELKNHIGNILDGNFSLTNAPDHAIIEQRIVSHPDLANFSYHGLPDIRIIVHNLIPIMAMIRFPTKASDGKANYHAGGAIAGIDLASGTITRLVIHDKSIKQLPDKPVSPLGFVIPQWDQVLQIASQAQLHSNIGYLAIDIVINKKGMPMVLEMNARGGLSIQIANRAKLRERLDRIKGLVVTTPEKGVRLGKELFGQQQTSEHIETEIERLSGKEILGSYEPVTLFAKNGKQERVAAVLNTNKIYTSIDKELALRLGIIDKNYEPKDSIEFFRILLTLGNKKIRTFVTIKDYSEQTFKVAVGRRNLRKVLIDPLKGLPQNFLQPPVLVSASLDQEKEADLLLAETYSKFSLMYYLKPINLPEQKKKWLKDNSYCPKFAYNQLPDFYDSALKELENIPQFDSDIGRLIKARAQELANQIALLQAIGTKEFIPIAEKVFRPLTPDEFTVAQNYARFEPSKQADSSPVFSSEQIAAAFQQVLAKYNIHNWRCYISQQNFSSIRVRKNHQIAIPAGKIVREQRLQRLVAHEVLTHILCQHNGEKQHWHIFSYGFPGYLTTQEGLAVMNEIHCEPDQREAILKRTATSALLSHAAANTSGEELMKKLLEIYKPGDAWRSFVRLKRGLIDTTQPGTVGRQNVYFLGINNIQQLATVPDIYYAGRISQETEAIAQKYNSLTEISIPQFPLTL